MNTKLLGALLFLVLNQIVFSQGCNLNGICDIGENCTNCPQDCPVKTLDCCSYGNCTTSDLVLNNCSIGCQVNMNLLNSTLSQGGTSGQNSSAQNNYVAPAVISAVLVFALIICLVYGFFTFRKKKGPTYTFSEAEKGNPLIQFESFRGEPSKTIRYDIPCVKHAAACHNPNFLYRPTMEDAEIAVPFYGGFESQAYFGLYDGHGGRFIVDQLKEKLHKIILERILKKNGDMLAGLRDGYLLTDQEITERALRKADRSGSTAVSAILHVNEDGEKWLYTANAGDSRIVLARKGHAVRMTFDHKPDDPNETARITNAGGFVAVGRVSAMLATSRSFGDFELKKWVIADPYLNQTELTEKDTHLILACDGLWDVCKDQEAVDLVRDESDAAIASQELVKYALSKGSKDNVTVLVVIL